MLDRSLALRLRLGGGLPRVRTARKQERQVSFIGARVPPGSRSCFKSAIARFCAQQNGERHCPELLTARVNNWILFRNKSVTNLLDRSLALRFKSVAGWPYAGGQLGFHTRPERGRSFSSRPRSVFSRFRVYKRFELVAIFMLDCSLAFRLTLGAGCLV